ncbi:MAG: histidine phosphatase family protein [Prevotella sp.]|nr:histidine phosphatase family protein [Prevotella sp.]
MRKNFILFLSFLLTLTATAQTVREEIAANPCLSASNYLSYPGPRHALAAAPEGYQPVYISHYGRHGSRYMIAERDYMRPIRTLEQADSAGVLTPKGRETLGKLRRMYAESLNRWGELTPLGASQHREIARRMYGRFPSVFRDSVWVDAKSTVVIRCILSMENELLELTRLNPRLRIRHDASMHDMYYMNLGDRRLTSMRDTPEAKAAYRDWCARHVDNRPLMLRLFTDTAYVRRNVKADDLAFQLFSLAGIIQNSEIRHRLSLYDLYTADDLYRQWRQANVYWYLNYGPAPQSGGLQPYSQRNLLRNIIHEADSCLALAHPGATLRFGHETMVMPLTCLLGLNGADRQVSDLDSLEAAGWVNYRIFPMGSNIQLVFYKPVGKAATAVGDSDILVRFLLNEDDATLPISSYAPHTPFYRWADVKAYCLAKLNAYRE